MPRFNKGAKNHKRSHSPSKNIFIIDSATTLEEFLRFHPSAINKVLCHSAFLSSNSALAEKLEELNLPLEVDDSKFLSTEKKLKATVEINYHGFSDLQADLKSNKYPILIAIDHITDPRNLGAIVRTAAFFGLKKIIVPERRQVLLTDACVATSMGGFAITDLVVVVNLSRTLEELKQLGYWIIGADVNGKEIKPFIDKFEKVVIVFGSEDKGLSKNIYEKCDELIAIKGFPNGLQSLNVSVAAGIIINMFVCP